MKKIKEYIKLIRLKHSLKNILIFMPIFFSKNITDISKLINSIIAFISFVFIAGFVYIINDYKDIENDKKHLSKRNRPLAAGTISKTEAIIFAIILIIASFVLNIIMLSTKSITSCHFILGVSLELLYIILNLAYSFGLKDLPIIDIIILVSGFLIRILYGAIVTNITISNWLYLTIIFGSFYMGLGKRRNEMEQQGHMSRKVLMKYNKNFLDKNMYVCLTLSIVFYSLWCIDASTIQRMENNLMVWTVPFIMILFMKYSLNIEGNSSGDPVDVILKDKILMLMATIYAILIFIIIYLL